MRHHHDTYCIYLLSLQKYQVQWLSTFMRRRKKIALKADRLRHMRIFLYIFAFVFTIIHLADFPDLLHCE